MSIVTTPREIQLLIFEQLRVVDIVRLSETCHQLKNIARDPSLWKKLTLTYESIENKTEACMNHVGRCSSLREIVITGEELEIRSDKIMAVLMKSNNRLTSINLSPSLAGLSDTSFMEIGEMTQLTHLAAGGENLGFAGMSGLYCLTELKTLKLPGIVCGLLGAQLGMGSLVTLFSKLKKLERVEIKMFDHFPSPKVLKSLIDNNPNLHHLDITPFGSDNRRDRTIVFSSKNGLVHIADKCPQLTHIGIGHLEFFESDIITKIVENCPKLKYANFEETNFDDTALEKMSKNCPDLEVLNIVGCDDVTGEALERFANPATTAKLKQLLVRRCHYSPQLLKRLRQNLPKVYIVAEDYEDSSDDDED